MILDAFPQDIVALVASVLRSIKDTTPHCGHALQRSLKAHHGMGWDGMGWDGMGWDVGAAKCFAAELSTESRRRSNHCIWTSTAFGAKLRPSE